MKIVQNVLFRPCGGTFWPNRNSQRFRYKNLSTGLNFTPIRENSTLSMKIVQNVLFRPCGGRFREIAFLNVLDPKIALPDWNSRQYLKTVGFLWKIVQNVLLRRVRRKSQRVFPLPGEVGGAHANDSPDFAKGNQERKKRFSVSRARSQGGSRNNSTFCDFWFSSQWKPHWNFWMDFRSGKVAESSKSNSFMPQWNGEMKQKWKTKKETVFLAEETGGRVTSSFFSKGTCDPSSAKSGSSRGTCGPGQFCTEL